MVLARQKKQRDHPSSRYALARIKYRTTDPVVVLEIGTATDATQLSEIIYDLGIMCKVYSLFLSQHIFY